ncbi:MAG: hypothetical protein GEEBNDBF_01770 [bacterium]|nr:hypothetical protein [bacterium]
MRHAALRLLFVILGVHLWSAAPAWAGERVLMLTLDDRPCNTILVQQLAAIAGVELELTTRPDRAGEAELVSLNAALFGSLVASRSGDPSRLTVPRLRHDALVHFAVPRVQPFVKDDATMKAYTAALESLKQPAIQEQVRAAIAGEGPMPADPPLADYAQRMRGWLDLLAGASIPPDRLLVTLDDNRPGPLAAWLKTRLRRYTPHVQDGTDEGMMLLLARWCRERQAEVLPPEAGIVFTSPSDAVTLQAFESGMPLENVLRMADWLHFRMTPSLKTLPSWRSVLWLHGSPITPERATALAQELDQHFVVVGDIAKLNAGDPGLFKAWSNGAMPAKLMGYAGWNTASNTLGTVMALMSAIDYGYSERSDPESVQGAVELFLWSRMLDDWLYMGVVRPDYQSARTAAGLPNANLSPEQVAAAIEQLQFRLLEQWGTLGSDLFAPFRFVDPGGTTGAEVTIPWARLFEIGVLPVDPRGFLPTIRPSLIDPAPR